MQVAGFLAPELAHAGIARAVRDKLRQMRAGDALEQGWTKDQILEAYLNLAGFRGEAQGIGAAALGLFGKTPDALSSRRRAAARRFAARSARRPPARSRARACALAHETNCTRFDRRRRVDARPGAQPRRSIRASRRISPRGC